MLNLLLNSNNLLTSYEQVTSYIKSSQYYFKIENNPRTHSMFNDQCVRGEGKLCLFTVMKLDLILAHIFCLRKNFCRLFVFLRYMSHVVFDGVVWNTFDLIYFSDIIILRKCRKQPPEM